MYETANQGSQHMILMTIRAIGDKHPKKLAEFLPILCDDNIFKPESLNYRSGIIAGVGGVNKVMLTLFRKVLEMTIICKQNLIDLYLL